MTHRFIVAASASALALASALGVASPASACGGFFCSQAQPVNQAAERIIFADHGDGTVTAIIQIAYQGPSESFSWLLPIASVPAEDEIGVSSDRAFALLQGATNPQFNLNTVVEGSCRSGGDNIVATADVDPNGNPSLVIPGADGEAMVDVEASGVIGAFDYVVLSVENGGTDPAAPALDWLADNGYDVPPGGAALLTPYLAEGMYLLALRLTKGSDTGSIRPLRITYAASAPMIPIKLTAVAANQDMGVMTWALSSARAVPMNYNALELNEARIDWFNPSNNYERVVTEAADEAGGQGFVTEFAGPSALLAGVIWSESSERDWQNIRAQRYESFSQIFDTLYANFQLESGFWDAVRRTVTPPDDVSFEDFQLCPTCYGDPQFSPSELLSAVDQDVIEPLRAVQRLIDAAPYTTRLYSTLSAAEMTVDPVFVFNPDLPPVDNVHTADRVVECHEGIYEWEAPWRIDFPQGTTIRGAAADVGSWPSAVDAQPPNARIRTLSTSGEGVVVADNTATIDQMLASYNASVPTPRGSSDGGGCGLSGAPRPVGPLPFALAALLGAAGFGRVRRRQRPGAVDRR